MSNPRHLAQMSAARSVSGHAAVVRLAWIFGDRDTPMLLRQPVFVEAVRHRHKVLILAPDLSAADQALLATQGIDSAPIGLPGNRFNPFAAVTARRRLAQVLHDWRASAAIVEDGEALELAVRAAVQAGIPAVYPLLPALEAGAGPSESKLSWRHALSLANAVFVPTPNDARLLAEPLAKLGVPYHQLPVITLDLDRIRAHPLPPIDDGFLFLGCDGGTGGGQMTPFAEAVTALDSRASRARFRLAEIHPALITAKASPRLERITVTSPIAETLAELVRAAHIVVVDGLGAQQTLLLGLALAVGRPVLVTHDACYRDFVDVGANGWLAPRGDAAALAQCMATILKRPDLLPGMARAARQKAERRLDQRVVVPLLFKALGLSDLRVQAA